MQVFFQVAKQKLCQYNENEWNKCNLQECVKNTGIGLSPVLGKVCARTLIDCVVKSTETETVVDQHSFGLDRCCADQIFVAGEVWQIFHAGLNILKKC